MTGEDRKREILEKLYYDKVDYRSNISIEIALTQLNVLYLKEIEEKLPKKKGCTNCPYNILGKCSKWDIKICYNNAIDEVLKILREMLGGER